MTFPFLPTAPRGCPLCAVKWNDPHEAAAALCSDGSKPFYHVLTDNGIAARFLQAVAANPEEAMAFVSKHSAGAIDLDALRDTLGQANGLCNSWIEALYSGSPKNCLTRSVILVDREHRAKQLLRLHMVHEPDRYGQWKIYGVEQE